MSDPRKPIFDAVRAANPGVFNHPTDGPMRINALDNVLDALEVPRAGVRGGMRTSGEGIALMKRFEGLARVRPDGRIEAYPDPGTGGEPWTIGWGSTGIDPFNGGRIRRGTIWTREQADQRFADHLAQFEAIVNRGVTGPTTQRQFDAMVSLTYNIGPGDPNVEPPVSGFLTSTLLRKHNAGDYAGAANEFARWNRAGGRVMVGLTRRRAAEAAMYRGA